MLFDNIDKIYRAAGLVHDEHHFKRNIQIGIVSTPNTAIFTELKEYIQKLTPANMDDQRYEINYSDLFALYVHFNNYHDIRRLMWGNERVFFYVRDRHCGL